jgi:hypothetical protein
MTLSSCSGAIADVLLHPMPDSERPNWHRKEHHTDAYIALRLNRRHGRLSSPEGWSETVSNCLRPRLGRYG